jgi:hypothetical protein
MSGDEPAMMIRALSIGQAELLRLINPPTANAKVRSAGFALANTAEAVPSTSVVVASPDKAAVASGKSPVGITGPASEHAGPLPGLRRRRSRGRPAPWSEAGDDALLEELRTGILTKPERAARHLQRPIGLPRALHLLLQAEALLRVQQTRAAMRCAGEAVEAARRPDLDGRVDEAVLLMACAVRADLACLQTAPDALATALDFFSVASRSTDEHWHYPAASMRAVALFHRGARKVGRLQLVSLIDRHRRARHSGRLHHSPSDSPSHPAPAAADIVQVTLGEGLTAMTPDLRPAERRLPDPWLIPTWGGLLLPDLTAPSRWLLTTRIAASPILR